MNLMLYPFVLFSAMVPSMPTHQVLPAGAVHVSPNPTPHVHMGMVPTVAAVPNMSPGTPAPHIPYANLYSSAPGAVDHGAPPIVIADDSESSDVPPPPSYDDAVTSRPTWQHGRGY